MGMLEFFARVLDNIIWALGSLSDPVALIQALVNIIQLFAENFVALFSWFWGVKSGDFRAEAA